MATEGDAETEVGTLGVSVGISVRVVCAADGDASIFVVVISDVTVSLSVVVGTVVESCVVDGKSAGAGTVPEVILAAEVIGCLIVLAVDTAVVDVVRVVDGVPVVAVLLVAGMTVSAVVFAGTGTSEGL